MRVPAVSSAIELISEAAGTLPAKVFVRSNDSKTADTEHPAYKLVHDEANDWTSASDLRTQLTSDALLYDQGGFALANRVNDTVVEFIRLDPTTVTIKTDANGEPVYVVGKGRGQIAHHYRDMLHIQAFRGLAPINRGREAIALAIVLEQHASRLFGNGARPSGVLSTGANMGDTALKNILDMWVATHGSGTSGRPAILPNGMTWEQIALTSVDAQFEQMRRFQTEEIARAFRVPPTMLFDLTRGTWSNTEEMGQQFLTYTLRPWLDAWQWAYARVLLAPEERATHYIEFVTDDLLTVSHAARAESYAKYRAMGVLTANEVRAGMNRAPLPGGDTLQNPYTTAPGANDNTEPTPQKDAA